MPRVMRILCGERLDHLLDAMLESMRRAPLPPPAQEIVVIQGRGLDRWISQQAALRLGGWGFVETLFPRPFLLRAFAAVIDGAVSVPPADDGLMRGELEMRVAAALPALVGDPRFAAVARVMRGPAEERADAALALAPRIAEALDRAAQHRVDRVRAWSADAELDEGAHPDEPWLAELWRRVAAEATPSRLITDRERFKECCARGEGVPAGLSARVAIFGVSTLAPAFMELLEPLARRVEVVLYVLDPCPGVKGHRVAARWGVESREFAEAVEVLEREGRAEVHRVARPAGMRVREARTPSTAGCASLLERLHGRLRGEPDGTGRVADGAGDGTGRVADGAGDGFDDSLQLLAGRGEIDEIASAHDAILELLRRDRTLEPRDVAILTPDLDRYGPIIEAVFSGRRDGADRPVLPFAVGDRDRSSTHAIEAMARLVELALSRCERRRVLEVLALAPVADAFGLGAADLEAIAEWSDRARIRWGLDAEHRASHGRPGEIVGTWRWGVDRLILGGVVAEEEMGALGTREPVAPLPAVEGGDRARLAALEAFLDALRLLAHGVGERRPLADAADAAEADAESGAPEPRASSDSRSASWLSIVDGIAERAVARDEPHAAGAALVRLRLATMRSAAQRGGFAGPAHAVSARSAARFIVERLREGHPGRGLLASGVTVAALQPMRSIPFKVMAVAGLADGAIPRRVSAPSFDLVAARRRAGDRDARLDDRQVMLETIFAASRALVLTWPGVDPTSGLPRPPSVLIDELSEVVPEARATSRAPRPTREACAAPAPAPPAAAPAAPARPATAPAPAPSACAASTEEIEPLTLEELERFWRSPAEAYLRHLGVQIAFEPRPSEEEDPIGREFERELLRELMPLALDPEDDETLAPRPASDVVLEGEGLLPRGASRALILPPLRERLDEWRSEAETIAQGAGAPGGLRESIVAQEIDLTLDVPPGEGSAAASRVRLTGRLLALRGVGPLEVVDRSFDSPRLLMRRWIRLLAAAASAPGAAGAAPKGMLLLGRVGSGTGDDRVLACEARLLAAPAREEALSHLSTLVAALRRGRRAPLAFMPQTSLAFSNLVLRRRDPMTEARALATVREEFAGEGGGGERSARPGGDGLDLAVRTLFGVDGFFERREGELEPAFISLARTIGFPPVRAWIDGVTKSGLVPRRASSTRPGRASP